MYKEKLEEILKDLENKNIKIAGGSSIGMVLATVNSLIKYIANLTLKKKNYENVQFEIKEIIEKSENLKQKSLNIIDDDKEILNKILQTYKSRQNNEEEYIVSCKHGAEFCMGVVNVAFDTLKLCYKISSIGNKMLESDFEICRIYAFASIKASIINVNTNLQPIDDEKYKSIYIEKCNDILKKANQMMN